MTILENAVYVLRNEKLPAVNSLNTFGHVLSSQTSKWWPSMHNSTYQGHTKILIVDTEFPNND